MTDSPRPDGKSFDAFTFVQKLSEELSAGKIDLPAFPDVAVRVRQVLADERVTPAKIELVVSTEPALAGKLLMIANSAALNPSGPRITSVKSAILRMGFNMVRSASLAFAMEQIRKAAAFVQIREPMNEIWERSLTVAGFCFVVARNCTKVDPDTALLAGLMHGVGRLYILTRAVKLTAFWEDTATYKEIVRNWHANIAKAILENWEISEEIIEAVGSYEDLRRTHRGETDLTDVLTVASMLASFRDFPDTIELNMQGVKAFERMHLSHDDVRKLLEESTEEIASLRGALGA